MIKACRAHIWMTLCGLIVWQTVSAAGLNDMAPEVNLPRLQGVGNVSLEGYAGKIIYLDFWASWCAPCQVSMPIMNEMRNRLQEQGVPFEVLAVNLDSDPEDGLDFLVDNPVDFIVLSDSRGETPARYGVRGMPTSYLIDTDGRIKMTHEGFKRSDAGVIEKRILELSGNKP